MRKAVACGLACCACVATLLTFGTIASAAQSKTEQNSVLALDHGWQFRQSPTPASSSGNDWLPATVPGDVHLDLLANKRIPDPFVRDNEGKLQWIEQAGWEYQLSFDVSSAVLTRANVDLVFDGLDAASQVFLNDAQVLSADNMFRVWRVPVKGHLHAGRNTLRVAFPSPIKAIRCRAALFSSGPF